jgi:hypothetical protein
MYTRALLVSKALQLCLRRCGETNATRAETRNETRDPILSNCQKVKAAPAAFAVHSPVRWFSNCCSRTSGWLLVGEGQGCQSDHSRPSSAEVKSGANCSRCLLDLFRRRRIPRTMMPTIPLPGVAVLTFFPPHFSRGCLSDRLGR